MRNMLIKTCSTSKQRALGTLISIKGRLIGNSSLWIFGRIDDEDPDIQPSRPICIIRKLVDTQRLFCIFGQKNPGKLYQAGADDNQLQASQNDISMISGFTSPMWTLNAPITEHVNEKHQIFSKVTPLGPFQKLNIEQIEAASCSDFGGASIYGADENDKSSQGVSGYGEACIERKPAQPFQFFKNQEIPQFNYDMMENTFSSQPSQQAVWNDYVDFKIRLIDNGDNKVTLKGRFTHISIICCLTLL